MRYGTLDFKAPEARHVRGCDTDDTDADKKEKLSGMSGRAVDFKLWAAGVTERCTFRESPRHIWRSSPDSNRSTSGANCGSLPLLPSAALPCAPPTKPPIHPLSRDTRWSPPLRSCPTGAPGHGHGHGHVQTHASRADKCGAQRSCPPLRVIKTVCHTLRRSMALCHSARCRIMTLCQTLRVIMARCARSADQHGAGG